MEKLETKTPQSSTSSFSASQQEKSNQFTKSFHGSCREKVLTLLEYLVEPSQCVLHLIPFLPSLPALSLQTMNFILGLDNPSTCAFSIIPPALPRPLPFVSGWFSLLLPTKIPFKSSGCFQTNLCQRWTGLQSAGICGKSWSWRREGYHLWSFA